MTRPDRDTANRADLLQGIAHAARGDGVVEPLPGLFLTKATHPSQTFHGASQPSFCVIAQGRKEVYLGDTRYRYDADHFLLATLDLPVTGRIVEASTERPYLALRLVLDPALVGSVMVEAGLPAPRQNGAKAFVVSPLDADLLDATVRLIRLLEAPDQTRVLYPLIQREIVFRILLGEQGNRLRHLPTLGGQTHLIARAVERLRKDFDHPLRMQNIARELGMSPSGFHQHFKTVTDMSPLQFQKQLRLHEARRLMLGENLDAASAGFRVGYNDASHFSRDYKKHFGASPSHDIGRRRGSTSIMVFPAGGPHP